VVGVGAVWEGLFDLGVGDCVRRVTHIFLVYKGGGGRSGYERISLIRQIGACVTKGFKRWSKRGRMSTFSSQCARLAVIQCKEWNIRVPG
jgi:hypothetical protein